MAYIRRWKNGAFKWKKDKRPEMVEGADYDAWMEEIGYENIQEFGHPEGYGYTLWQLKNKRRWIVTINAGDIADEIQVKSIIDLSELMSKLAPGAIAAALDGEELMHFWAERASYREYQKEAQAQTEALMKVARDSFDRAMNGCDDPNCPNCKALKERKAQMESDRKARAN